MYEIERRFNNQPDTHKIYTKEEADERGIDYVYWKDAEPGDWALTDDDHVSECYRVYEAKTGNRQVVLTGGKGWDTENSEINFLEYYAVGNYNYNKPQTHMAKEARYGRTQVPIKVYARQRMQGVKHKDMPWELLGKLYRPDEKRPDLTIKKVMKSEEVQQKVAEEIIKIMDERNLDDEELVRQYQNLLQEAQDKGDLSNWNRALETLLKARGSDKPRDKKKIERTASFAREITEDLEREAGHLEETEYEEIDEGDQKQLDEPDD